MKLAIAALVGLAMAQDLEVNPDYEMAPGNVFNEDAAPMLKGEVATQTDVEQDHFWAYSDMLMGVMIGFYVPMNQYARNDDCFSQFWGVAAA